MRLYQNEALKYELLESAIAETLDPTLSKSFTTLSLPNDNGEMVRSNEELGRLTRIGVLGEFALGRGMEVTNFVFDEGAISDYRFSVSDALDSLDKGLETLSSTFNPELEERIPTDYIWELQQEPDFYPEAVDSARLICGMQIFADGKSNYYPVLVYHNILDRLVIQVRELIFRRINSKREIEDNTLGKKIIVADPSTTKNIAITAARDILPPSYDEIDLAGRSLKKKFESRGLLI